MDVPFKKIWRERGSNERHKSCRLATTRCGKFTGSARHVKMLRRYVEIDELPKMG